MKTFEETANDESGTIYKDWYEKGVRCIIMRGPCSLCAYLGILETHPLANRNYDDIPLEVHGGLTFSDRGDSYRPKGFYWYGWDYAHSGDYPFYNLKYPIYESGSGKKWTVEEVEAEVRYALPDFKKLMKIAE